MAIYRVLLDGVDIYDPTSKGMVLIDPVVHTEAGAAGNFEFTMPPMHVFYNNVTPYGSSIEVLEDENSIFFGRPLKPKIGFYNQKTYHCEGALAFLNDTRPTDDFVYEHTTPTQYFRDLIAYHNSFQSKNERKLIVGNITVNTDLDVYREMTPSMTIMEHIKRGCIGSDGGYLFTRRVNGVTYIDWTKDMPYTCNQTVEFALNLLDMSRSGNDDIYTGVMLKGGERRIKKNGKILNSVVQYGPKWGSAEAIAKYGEILGYQEYPDITDVDDLIAAGAAFLSSQQFESMIFEVSAAERHYLNASLDIFKAGQKVHLVSNPHFVDMMLPVQSVEVRLDSAEKKVTLGTQRRQTLTKIQRKTKEEQEIKDKTIEELTYALDIAENNIDDMQVDIDDIQTNMGDLIDNQGIIQGDDGNLYQIGVDENGNIYAQQLAYAIAITRLPDKLEYNNGEIIDYTGIEVTLLDQSGNPFPSKKYPDGIVPFEELVFPIQIASAEAHEGDKNPSSSANQGGTFFYKQTRLASGNIEEWRFDVTSASSELRGIVYLDSSLNRELLNIMSDDPFVLKSITLINGEQSSERVIGSNSANVSGKTIYYYNNMQGHGPTVIIGMVTLKHSLSTTPTVEERYNYLFGPPIKKPQELPVNWNDFSESFYIDVYL